MVFSQHRILKRLAKALIRLRVHTGRTYHIVGNLMHWLNFYLNRFIGFRGPGYNFPNNIIFLSLKIDFVEANSAEMMMCRLMRHFIWVYIVCHINHIGVFSPQRDKETSRNIFGQEHEILALITYALYTALNAHANIPCGVRDLSLV